MSVNKNVNLIQCYRILFTYMIIVMHLGQNYGYHSGWAIGVDFFFITSGFLVAKDANEKRVNQWQYLLRRYKRLYPEYLGAFIIATIGYVINNFMSFEQIVGWFVHDGYKEALMIHCWPWGEILTVNGVTWYISVMLLVAFLLYGLSKNCPNLLCDIILPVIIVLGYTYSYRVYGNLFIDGTVGNVITVFTLRGCVDMGVGYLIYKLDTKIDTGNIPQMMRRIASHVMVVVVIVLMTTGDYSLEYICIVLLGGAIWFGFNTPLAMCKKVIQAANRYMYSVYLNHLIFRNYVFNTQYFCEITLFEIVLYIVVVTLFAIMMYHVVDIVMRWITCLVASWKWEKV